MCITGTSCYRCLRHAYIYRVHLQNFLKHPIARTLILHICSYSNTYNIRSCITATLPPGIINIRFITNNYNYISHAILYLLNILTHALKYIFIIIQSQQISFCITPLCIFDIYLIESSVCELVLLSLPSYMNIW